MEENEEKPSIELSLEEKQTNALKFIIKCISLDNIEELVKELENPNVDEVKIIDKENLNKKCYQGKTLLDIVAMLGGTEVLQELSKHSVANELVSSNGYTLVHHAASWGNVDCMKLLVENGCDIESRTKHGETARQLAVRYNKTDCVSYLDLIAAKQTLEKFIADLKDKISDPEKMQGVKLSKEEKSTLLNACSEKLEWIENNPEAQVDEYLSQKHELEEKVEPIMNKPISSTPNTATSGKK